MLVSAGQQAFGKVLSYPESAASHVVSVLLLLCTDKCHAFLEQDIIHHCPNNRQIPPGKCFDFRTMRAVCPTRIASVRLGESCWYSHVLYISTILLSDRMTDERLPEAPQEQVR